MAGVEALRRLARSLPREDFLHSSLARRWVSEGRLVDFELVDALTVRSPRQSFVSLPDEWCDAQLFDAAVLTLDLQDEAIEAGFDLKDASAWNVIFDGSHPIFCDLLSFESLTHKPWWAAGQLARHFLLPLLLARKRGYRAANVFRVWRDGVPTEVAREMLGPLRYFTRYWPLMAVGGGSQRPSLGPAGIPLAEVQRHRRSLQASLRWMLEGVRPFNKDRDATVWANYESQRGHYVEDALEEKRRQVAEWLERIRPEWVADFGCNAGEFSMLARSCGAQVVALDADHSAIQRLYRALGGKRGIHPLFVSVDDIGSGRGWAGEEVPGLASRLTGCFDVVMMLALIHHLAVGAGVRLHSIARFARQCTRSWVIVEWIHSDDPLLQLLCEERRRDSNEFSMERQKQAFLDEGFVIESMQELPRARRVLALLRRAPA